MLDIHQILTIFHNTAINIVVNLRSTVLALSGSLLLIDLTLSMLFNDDDGLKIFMTLVKKILIYGFFLWIILNFQKIVFNQVLNGFIQLGNVASGVGNSTTFGFSLVGALKNIMKLIVPTVFASTGAITALDEIGVESIPIGMVMTLIGIIFFVVMTILEVVITFIKFYLVGAFAFIFLPFGFFSKTRDIATKGLHAIFSMGVEIMVLVTVVNLTSNIMPNPQLTSQNMNLTELLTTFIASIFFFFLIKRVPSIVSTLLSGSISSFGMTEHGASGAMGVVISNTKQIGGTLKDTYNAYKNASHTETKGE